MHIDSVKYLRTFEVNHMNQLTKFCYRIYQKLLYVAQFFLPINEPDIISGNTALNDLVLRIKNDHFSRVLIVSQIPIIDLEDVVNFIGLLKAELITVTLFKDTTSNPTILQIETAKALYLDNQCQAIIAIGGGSAIDLAKGVGALIARPNKSLQQMKGILKVGKKIPMLYAVPTTSGTGSEATLACVVTDSLTKEKYAINDPVLIPKVAVLDSRLTIGLPSHLTSTTGMDALTHAIEAYIGQSNTKKTKRFALEAIELIFGNLLKAYQNPTNLEYRNAMQLAAYKAGVAFTKAYVGNVHAIAHTLGGMYHVPHGLANAVILPYILTFYGSKIDKKLAKLAKLTHISNPDLSIHDNALAFIDEIKTMNKLMGIPSNFDGIIQNDDLDIMVKRALREANPLYPVPVIMDEKAFKRIYSLIQD